MITQFHGKYYTNKLLLKKSYSDESCLSSSLFYAALNINPHQVHAALHKQWSLELQELNTKKSKMCRNLEDNEDAVYEKRNALIEEIKNHMVKDTKLEEIYTIAWEVI